MRSRRLFELAESYCSARLKEGGLSETRQADLVAELSVTLVEQALHSPPEDREPLWRKAWEVTGQFAENNPTHPRLLLVQTQGALARVARGELGRQESEVLGDQEDRRKQAREFLREAIRTLGELSQQAESACVKGVFPDAIRPSPPATLSVYSCHAAEADSVPDGPGAPQSSPLLHARAPTGRTRSPERWPS